MTYTYLIINSSVAVFALCALLVVMNQRIEKNIISWFILIGVVVSAISMLINQKFYSVSFASFAMFAALIAVYVTYRVYERGRL